MNVIEDLLDSLAPKGCPFFELQELFDIRNGYTPSKANAEYWNEGDIPWFRMEDIRANGRVLGHALQQVPEKAIKGGKSKLFPANSILVATSATIGEHALITVPHISNQRFTSLAIKSSFTDRLNSKFAFYYSFVLADWCLRNTTTSSFASVDMAGFKKFKFPVPPLEVQEKIVEILDTFASLEAELEAELEARKKQYEYYRNQLLTFPQEGGVKWVPIREIADCFAGATPSSQRAEFWSNGTIPWMSSGEVNKKLITSTEKLITQEAFDSCSTRMIPKNSVVIALAGQGKTRGLVARTRIELCTNQSLCSLVTNGSVSADFLYFYLSTQYLQLRSASSGDGTRGGLNLQIIKSYLVPVPSLETQKLIVDILESFESLVNDISSGLPAELDARRKQYEYYRNKLLTFKELEG